MEAVRMGPGDKTMPKTPREIDLCYISDDDVHYEQELLRDAFSSTKPWLRYVEFKTKNGSLSEQVFVFERACRALPRSYKIWKMYLDFRVNHLYALNPAKYRAEYCKVNNCFERSLILLNKMPTIWIDYLHFLQKQCLITKTRRVFDRALRALPITQHHRIWKLYIPFANAVLGETSIRIWRRFIQIHPEDSEDYIELLVSQGRYQDAAQLWIDILDNPRFKSKENRSHFQMWSDLCDLLVTHAADIHTIDVERIVRSGIIKFSDQRGKLWTSLGTYWITKKDFERARDAFEEGITTVMTVRDFTQIFDSYTEFEESILGSQIEEATARKTKGLEDGVADLELDMRLLRFEQLMDRRSFLVNDVLLRQNPNHVVEWERRVGLWGDNKEQIVQTYTDAIAAVNPKKAVGQFHTLWAGYAKFYERHGDIRQARIIMEKAVRVPFKSVQELAEMWIEWAEMELRNDNFDEAIRIMAKSTQAPKRSTVDYFDETLTPQQRVHKSWKLWSFYVDLVESVSTLEETRKVYERIFELRIATPQTVVNYANLLEENKYFEESFKVYERGLDLFSFPVAFELWNLYLSKAVHRRIDIERLRDLFEQAVDGCPPKFAKTLYLMYGNLEEERGLARHAMRIYERATRAVSDEDRFEMFEFYITKSASNFGLTSTRPIYERAIEALPDKDAKMMCLKFAEMERRLGEIDRARAIYGHASQFSDPRISPEFWEQWEKFEIQHGNEDTFKEMLRIKRSVQAQYNTDVNFIASQALARGQHKAAAPADADDDSSSAVHILNKETKAPQGFVAASTNQHSKIASETHASNPDAIDLDMDD